MDRAQRALKYRSQLSSDADQKALQTLLRLIGSRHSQRTFQTLAKSALLARIAVSVGATRHDVATYSLARIGHYIYTGDTALHVASAAHELDIARELISRGAGVRARNRSGAEPLHYAADGVTG